MTKSKKLWVYRIAFIVIPVIAVIGLSQAFDGDPKVVVEGNYIEASPVVNPDQNLGALASPDIPYNWFSVGGVGFYAQSKAYDIAGTSTVCAFLNADNATSSLLGFSWTVDKATTSATNFFLATSTSAYGTTSAASAGLITADQAELPALTAKKFTWTAPGAGNTDAMTIPPNSYLILTTEGAGSYSGWDLQGKCEAWYKKY